MLGKLLAGAWGYIAAAGAVIVALLTLLAGAKKAGKNEVIADAAKKELEDVRTANAVDQDVASTKPSSRRDELRKYQRD